MDRYLLTHNKEDLLLILRDQNKDKHFSVNINFIELFEIDTNLGNQLLKSSEEAFVKLDNWCLYSQNKILEESDEKDTFLVKSNIHARVYGLPACPDLHRFVFPRVEDSECFLQITGTVVKTKDPRMLEYRRPYQCSKCKHIQIAKANYNIKYIITTPKKCLNPENCPGRNFVNVGMLSSENCKDYQEIKIQEQSSNATTTMPSTMWVTLEDDLVDVCKPGDDVTICGIVKLRWDHPVVGKSLNCELCLKANHIQVHNGNTVPTIITSETEKQFNTFWKKYEKCPLEGRDSILKSFCSKLYGMYLVKLSLVVVLAGGSNKSGSEHEIHKRGQSHILLVGDPGTGKSQLLRYSSKIMTRSVLTTGIGTTSAGLTVAAVQEDGQWQLEAGALVLADGGICCIDEFNSMKAQDRASIHEAMEQQTISVAKAGIHTKLKTRCTILAATNPKGGHLDPSQPLSLNLAIPGPLLSRFDVVLMLKDTYEYERECVLAKHVLYRKSHKEVCDEFQWSLETLQQYFTLIKTLNPTLSPEADQILAAYYQAQRQGSARNKSRTTVRLLESLIRLSQGHAKLMLHREVWVMDAVFAVLIIECSMHGECAVLSIDSLDVMDSFPDDPMKNYAKLCNSILSKLGLNDILESEMKYLESACSLDLSSQNDEALNNSDFGQPGFSSTQNTTTTKILIPFYPDENVVEEFQNEKSNSLNTNCNTELNTSNLNSEKTNQMNADSITELDLQKQTPKNIKKRKHCSNTNMFDLIKSVNDDFNSCLESDRQIEPTLNQETATKVLKKFKFKPKKSENEYGEIESTNKEAISKDTVHFKTPEIVTDYKESKPSTSFQNTTLPPVLTTIESPNQNDKHKSVFNDQQGNTQCFSMVNNETVSSTKKTSKTNFKSKYKFVPKDPPSAVIATNPKESSAPAIKNTRLSMFDSDDENFDFFNLD